MDALSSPPLLDPDPPLPLAVPPPRAGELGEIRPSQLGDPKLFDFLGLAPGLAPRPTAN